MYKALAKPLLFNLDAERALHLVFDNLRRAARVPGTPALLRTLYDFQHPSLEREVFGLKFPNPVGLAAGLDKNAVLTDELASLGFGFVEIGTVTPRPQAGNPLPRLFRLPQDEALVNRMGFNNDGAAVVAARLARRRNRQLLIGGNIGKNKDTPNERAADDYVAGFEALAEVVDYFVVNVSSPNTPGLRELQEKKPLIEILQQVQARNQGRTTPRPLLLKIAPDLTDSQLDDILEIARETQLSGLVATNTTISRADLRTEPGYAGAGYRSHPLPAPQIRRWAAHHWRGRRPFGGRCPREVGRWGYADSALYRLYLRRTGAGGPDKPQLGAGLGRFVYTDTNRRQAARPALQ